MEELELEILFHDFISLWQIEFIRSFFAILVSPNKSDLRKILRRPKDRLRCFS